MANEGQEGLWLRADRQTGGIGRLGRKWESPSGNLYCSTIVDIDPRDPSPSSLSFVVALAVYDLLAGNLINEKSIKLKWPNDVLVNSAKISGILLENVLNKIVVGVGLNVAFHPDLSDRQATSIHHANPDSDKSAEEIFSQFVPLFGKRLEQWRDQGVQSIFRDWQEYAHQVGDVLHVSVSKEEKTTGEYGGLNEVGALRLRKPDGTLIEIHAGDIELG